MPLVPVARAARVDIRIVRRSPPWVTIEAEFLTREYAYDDDKADECQSQGEEGRD